MTTEIRALLANAMPISREILGRGEVAERWDEPSALDLIKVSGLSGHLVRAITSVNGYLDGDAPPGDVPHVDAPGYFLSIDGLDKDINSELHAAIRRRGDEMASVGHVELLHRWDHEVTLLQDRLQGEPRDRMVTVFDGRVMRLDDYLVTRMVELVVHTDDLAVSVEVPPPSFEREAGAVVIRCLVEVARRRHGDMAVITALTRRERDVGQALRVV